MWLTSRRRYRNTGGKYVSFDFRRLVNLSVINLSRPLSIPSNLLELARPAAPSLSFFSSSLGCSSDVVLFLTDYSGCSVLTLARVGPFRFIDRIRVLNLPFISTAIRKDRPSLLRSTLLFPPPSLSSSSFIHKFGLLTIVINFFLNSSCHFTYTYGFSQHPLVLFFFPNLF